MITIEVNVWTDDRLSLERGEPVVRFVTSEEPIAGTARSAQCAELVDVLALRVREWLAEHGRALIDGHEA